MTGLDRPVHARDLGVPARQSGALLVALPLLLYAFLPRPPISGAQYLAFPAMAAVLGAFVLLAIARHGKVPSDVVTLLLLLALLDVATVLSFYANVVDLRTAALVELIRPAVFILFLLYGYFAASGRGEPVVHHGLLLAAKAILVGETIIAAAQLAGLSAFDLVYSAEKARGLGSLLRVTGSMGNPNMFGWLVAQASIVVLLLGHRRWTWLSLGSLLLLAAGSRTLLLLFPFMLALAGVWRRGGGLSNSLRLLAVAVTATVLVVFVVLSFRQYFPYLGQLRIVLLSGSLDSISSFARRLRLWNAVYRDFSRGGLSTWLLGLGSRESTRVLDNDFLYVLFRLGAIGFVIHATTLAWLGLLLNRAKRHPVAMIGMAYLVFSLVLGFMYETLGGWNFPVLLFFFVGLSLGLTTGSKRAIRRLAAAPAGGSLGRV